MFLSGVIRWLNFVLIGCFSIFFAWGYAEEAAAFHFPFEPQTLLFLLPGLSLVLFGLARLTYGLIVSPRRAFEFVGSVDELKQAMEMTLTFVGVGCIPLAYFWYKGLSSEYVFLSFIGIVFTVNMLMDFWMDSESGRR